MEANDIETLFLEWWNFPGAMEDHYWSHAQGLIELDGPEGVLGEHVIEVPFVSDLIRDTLSPALPSPPNLESVLPPAPASILDSYLWERSPIRAFYNFQDAISNTERIFRVSFSTGKVATGTLANLCALRLAGIISKRPSPIFYDENYAKHFRAKGHQAMRVLSPHICLPTLAGLQERAFLVAKPEEHGIPQFLYFLSGNFLPEVHGFVRPLSIGPFQWKELLRPGEIDSRADQHVADTAEDKLGVSKQPLPESVRITLLALVFLSRKILTTLPPFLRRPLAKISDLGLPWRGNSHLGTEEQKLFGYVYLSYRNPNHE